MWLGVKKSSFWFYSILFLIAAYPFNIRLFGFLSPPDIIFVTVFAIAVLRGGLKKSKINPLVYLFLLFFLGTVFVGCMFYGFSVHYLVFLYKYLVVFLLVWFILSADLKKDQISFLLAALLFSFCYLVLYVYFYQYLLITGAKVFLRPDFPFSSIDSGRSGGHLYGAYLSTGLLASSAYLIFISKRSFFWIMLSLLAIGAVLLTGSRAPMIVLLIGYVSLFLIYALERKTLRSLKNIVILIMTMAVSGLIFGTILIENNGMYQRVSGVIDRAVRLSNIASGDDTSIIGRAQKIEFGMDKVLNSSVIFGTGVSSTPYVWVDNSPVRLIIDSGFGGLAIFSAVIIMFIFNAFKTAKINGNLKWFYVLLLACLAYFINSVSTEFFLVSRSIFPFLILVCLLYRLLSMPDIYCKTGNL